MALVEQFIRDSDNLIKLTLTEDGEAISGAWTGLDIIVGGITLTRTADADGITLSVLTGILTISPGDLTTGEKDSLATLTAGRTYPVTITVTSAANDDGAVFGGAGSTRILFHISDKPA